MYKVYTCQFLGEEFEPRDLSVRYDENGKWLNTDHFMCGDPVVAGRSYCEDHIRVVFTDIVTKKRNKQARLQRVKE